MVKASRILSIVLIAIMVLGFNLKPVKAVLVDSRIAILTMEQVSVLQSARHL